MLSTRKQQFGMPISTILGSSFQQCTDLVIVFYVSRTHLVMMRPVSVAVLIFHTHIYNPLHGHCNYAKYWRTLEQYWDHSIGKFGQPPQYLIHSCHTMH